MSYEQNSALDVEKLDERDFLAGGELLDIDKMPDDFILTDDRIVNQRIDKYKMSCTAQATAGASNEYLKIHADYQTNNSGFDLFDIAVEMLLANRKKGAYLIDIIKLGKEIGFVDLYYQVSTQQEIMNSIYNGEPIITGSNKIKWSDIRKDGLVKEVSSGSGHAFYIKGWDKNKKIGKYTGGFICKNSYGKDYQEKGNFRIPFELFDKILFITRKAIIVEPEWQKIPAKERWANYQKRKARN